MEVYLVLCEVLLSPSEGNGKGSSVFSDKRAQKIKTRSKAPFNGILGGETEKAVAKQDKM